MTDKGTTVTAAGLINAGGAEKFELEDEEVFEADEE